MSFTTLTTMDKPLIDRAAGASLARRLLLLGGALILFAAVLALVGHAYGGTAVLVVFGLLAIVGMAAIFAGALGFLELTGRVADGAIARVVLDSAEIGALVADRRGRILYANRAYGELTGARTGAETKTLERLLAREPEASEAIYHLANLARENQAGQREFRLGRPLSGLAGPEASPRWYRATVRPLSTESQTLQAWSIADVTADRQLQETSFKELQHAIDYLDKAPAGFFAADGEWRLVYLNATLAGWLGIDLAEFRPLGPSLYDFLPPNAHSRLALKPGSADEEGRSIIDLTLSPRGGGVLPVRLLVKPVAGEEGAPGMMRVLVLSRGLEAEAATDGRNLDVGFSQLFDSSPMGIAALERSGRVRRCNPAFAQIFGAAVAEGEAALGTDMAANDREGFSHALEAAMAGRPGAPFVDVDITGARPRSVRLYLSSIPAQGGEGKDAAILYCVDVTAQRALEEQVAKSQKMQAVGNLAGGIAHDFNNVLTIITASVDFLLLNHRTGDPSFQDLLLIKQSANRAASLVRQLLAYSRRQTMRPKMLNLTDVIADMHLLLKRVSGETVKLERHHARDLWPVMADIGQFEQVVTNLVQNARDAMPKGGTISIATRNVGAAEAAEFRYAEMPAGEYVLVEVADNGTGMPADVAERIFEPFFTTKDIGKGTGLGLSMVYGIVKQSGGFIFVETKPDQGTMFRIFLPRHVPAEQPATRPDVAQPVDNAKRDLSGTASILLVEDEDNVRAVNVRALRMRGYEVHEASSGLDALEVMEEIGGKVDLVVSDVMMPEMDGPTLLTEMRKTRPDLKFVFVSGYAEDAFKNLPEGETFGFLAKPFSLRDLAVTVKEMLDS
ncbi:PAS domain-containing protein [Aurantimonas sp. Leaf443]|uniref:cell cycle histidine kinase CckA n=1 Tax=Aurantimonas sp. Leaf443 TaxID=1736378 RepID=UPI0006F24A4D|nr:PAS domain-containing protein [Aurantimonas sp. Leaf443]KQT86240.1 histidine kinase [Aurantimonas sp. Leaf443]